jgi:hypothetical protein
MTRLRLLPGVREAHLVNDESTAYLKVDSAEFDEHNVLEMITGR